jgi:hypothetical protein
MNAETFSKYAAENPDAAEVKSLFAKGHKAGSADARADEAKRLTEILAACPGKEKFAVEQFLAGHDAESVKATVTAIDAALTEANARADALAKEVEKLKALNGTVGAVGGKKDEEPGSKTPPAGLDAKAQAAWEWDNDPETHKTAANKDIYVAAREAELAGTHRTYTRKAD